MHNGIHSFVSKRASGRTARHHALNELVARAFVSAGIPVTKEPDGLSSRSILSVESNQNVESKTKNVESKTEECGVQNSILTLRNQLF